MDDQNGKSIPQGTPGVSVGARFWFFENKISGGSLNAREAKLLGQRLILIASLLVTVFLLALAIFGLVIDYQENPSYLFQIDTYFTASPYMLAMWFGLLSISFIFFRAFEGRTKKKFMPKVKPKATLNVSYLPSLDIVEKHGNIGDLLSTDAWETVKAAYELADKGGHSQVLPVHLFAASLSSTQVRTLFMRLGIGFDDIKDALRRNMNTIEKGSTDFGTKARTIISFAFLRALKNDRQAVSSIEIFAECYAQDEFLQELLYSIEIEKEEVENTIEWIIINDRLQERYHQFRRAAGFKSTGAMNKAYTSVETPFLDRVSEDLTLAAVRGRLPMLVGRDREVEELLRSIEGGRQSVVLVGAPGVGKKAIIYGIAERMAAERVPEILQDKRLVKISVPHIVSADAGSGAEERMLYALQEVGRSGNIVLIIENIDQMIGGMAGGVDLSPILASELEKGYTFVIATTTPQGYTSAVERSVLAQQFTKIQVEEPSRNEAIHILESKIGAIENINKVIFSYPALAKIVDLSERYMHENYLPEKAILLAQEVGNLVMNRGQEWAKITEDDVAELISQKTNIPMTDVSAEEGAKLLNLESKMHERIIGQEEAVKAVSSALRRARVELRSEKRPIANFLFLGPTGVGKTELAKTTAEVYFGNEESMLRFDMSEYQDKSSINRLIGMQGEGGLLTEAVRKNPFSLLLLDELEKADPDILNLFLQVMDDGRLTDGAGRTIDFTNVILIATSNAGTQYIQDEVEKGISLEVIKEHLLEEELRTIYRPEFLNRFDGVMVFKPLTQENVEAIAHLMMQKVAKRLEAKGITFTANDQAIRELAEKGYDPKFGARPLRRVIQENVDNAVAEFLLQGKVSRRDTLVLEPGGAIRVEKAAEL
ncbi:ATP-dependent Clp protease ATP-binding subunit [Patescibacteria group bacterium]|nr:ATP-dependent Clp protease ATP-binding subunit [Patescibacteria group bacterium]